MVLNKLAGYKFIKRHGPTGSELWEKGGISILYLYGNPYERGTAHGELLKEKIFDSGINRYYGSFLKSLYYSSDVSKKIPGKLKHFFGDILDHLYYTPLEKMMLDETKEELYGVSDALGLDRRESVRGTVSPDLMENLAAGFLKGGKESLGNYYLGGCSGAYARKSALKAGAKAMFARNMDFPGVFAWKYPTVIYSFPTEEVEMYVRGKNGSFLWEKRRKEPYVYVSTAGSPGTGLTGMNSAGVAMGMFVYLSKNVAKRGMLSLDFNHYLLTRTESIEGIEQLLKDAELTCGTPHAAFFADRERAITVENDAKRNIIRKMEDEYDIMVQTNHYHNPMLKKDEMEFPLAQEATVGRYRLINDALEENYGSLTVQRMIDIISCNYSAAAEETRLLGVFPAQPNTLTSVVFEPETKNFWVAGGKPPAVCYNRYIGFPFPAERNGSITLPRLPAYTRSNRPVFRNTSHTPVTEEMRASLRRTMLSQEYLKLGKLSSALSSLRRAIELYDEPPYHYIIGILYLKNREFETALQTFQELRKNVTFPPVKHSLLFLWEGRALDLLGRREEAVRVYREGLEEPGLVPHVKEALRKGAKRSFVFEHLPASFDYYLFGPMVFT